mgnify:FL=1
MTKNFSIGEFKCKCGCIMPDEVLYNVVKLVNQLQTIRDVIKTPIQINSAYRCKTHNQAVNGSESSQHILGKAADIVVRGYNPSLEIYPLIEELIKEGLILQGGLGDYPTFTHYDIRKTKARW